MRKETQNQQDIFFNKTDIDSVFTAQVNNRRNVSQTSTIERIAKLKKIENWIIENKQAIREAIYKDFRKPAVDVDLTEIFTALSEIRHAIKHLKKWVKPKHVKRTMALITTRSWIQYEPRGVVLIIAPWNYPFNLIVTPLLSAIAAGDCVILKPSELAAHTSNLISNMVEELFSENEVAVFEGEKDVAIELLKKPFDHIFFTGNAAVGKKVMQAASKNLSSITLELGGKSPVVIDETAYIADAAQKIVWGKFMNCGQTCLGPDYLLVNESVLPELISKLKYYTKKFYGTENSDWQTCPDYARIIDNNHFQRLARVLNETIQAGAKIEIGGDLNEDEKYISPTVLIDVKPESAIMEEEIFGPILPIMTYTKIDDAINTIRGKPKPLALYIFSKNQRNIDRVLAETSSGGVCINDTVIHFSQSNLPFGGVNDSGTGRTHGFFGFKTFSNEKAVVKHNRFSLLKLMYPPYTKRVRMIVDFVVKYF
ncbi:aldehyde dehydrogenase family protein [bacterium]|nr:aldehyde dehydrogenase family protein [bacterium]